VSNLVKEVNKMDIGAQAIRHAEQALIIFEQIEHPKAAKVRAQIAAWREQTNI
jgi:hypothetical protein